MWRKTTVLSDPIASTYKLTNQRTNLQLNVEQYLPYAYIRFEYCDSITVDKFGENITMNNTSTIDVYISGQSSVLSGKFFKITFKSSEIDLAPGVSMNKIYYMPNTASIRSSGTYYLYAETIYDVVGVAEIEAVTDIKYLTSTNINEYEEGTVGNIIIKYLCQIGNMVRVIIGSYLGNGLYGKDNPNILEFDNKPYVIFISAPQSSRGGGAIFIRDQLNTDGGLGYQQAYLNIELNWVDNSVSFFSYDSAEYQLNVSGERYHYIAFL